MSESAPRLLLCDCTGTMRPDAGTIAKGTGLTCDQVHTHLCRAQAAVAASALKSGDQVIIACGQEAPAFLELAEEMEAADRLLCVDIRDRAGWSDDDTPAPKMAALIADARLAPPGLPLMDIESEGLCLLYGTGDMAVDAAARLAPALSVTCMLTSPAEAIVPADAGMDIVTGRIRTATGALGQFALEIDAFAELAPAGRGPRRFAEPRDGAKSDCDIIVDLSGGQPLFPAHHKRDGYLRADPGDPLAVERVLFDAAQLTGTFEKPLHIRFEEALCAHSRAGRTGCTRCLDVCPTSAIMPDGDTVRIDPNICAGCGACHAVCPSGAAASDDPPVAHLFRRVRIMADAYAQAGGKSPRLLVHDDHGAEMIRLAARHGRGLPGDVIPLEIPSLSTFGHAEQVTALALGYAGIDILAGPRTEHPAIEAQIALAAAIASGTGVAGERIRLIDPADPDTLSGILYIDPPAAHPVQPILPLGGRRDAVRLAARALAGDTPPDAPLPLPAGAPFGAVLVDTDACTLCLACAGLCPTGALLDNPDSPELSFREEACLQCGICVDTCPEDAITLVPQLDLADSALSGRVLNEEEPFACIECGALFGVKSTIDRITEKLAGKHSMFTNSDNVRLIQMCDDCRIRAQTHSEGQPFYVRERPRPRTTDDYLKERETGEGED